MVKLKDKQNILSNNLEKLTLEIENEVKNAIQEPPPDQRFHPIEKLREKAAIEAREGINQYKTLIEKGMTAITDTLIDMKRDEDAAAITEWFTNNTDKINDLVTSESKELETTTLEEIIDFPRENLIAMHDAVTHLLEEKKYDEAIAGITVCLQINSTLSPLWTTYGLILQARENHDGALYVFQIASILDENNPYILAHMARSWIILGHEVEAQQCVKEVEAYCEAHHEFQELANYCKELTLWIEKQKGNKK